MAEAEQWAHETVKWMERRAVAGNCLMLPGYRNHCGQCLRDLGRFDEAEQALNLVYDGEISMRGQQHRNTQETIANLVHLYELWGKPDEAAAWRAKLPATQPATTQP